MKTTRGKNSGWPLFIPVGYINVNNASFQELPLLVRAGHEDPALVMREAVSHKEHVVFWRELSPYLALFWLFGAGGAQDEGRTVELQWAGMLEKNNKQKRKGIQNCIRTTLVQNTFNQIQIVVGRDTAIGVIETNLETIIK